MEEGATLAWTLLPYLNQVRDYRFLPDDANFIACRFLASLVRDTEITIGAGFVLYALKLNPHSIKDIFDNQDNVTALKEALRIK